MNDHFESHRGDGSIPTSLVPFLSILVPRIPNCLTQRRSWKRRFSFFSAWRIVADAPWWPPNDPIFSPWDSPILAGSTPLPTASWLRSRPCVAAAINTLDFLMCWVPIWHHGPLPPKKQRCWVGTWGGFFQAFASPKKRLRRGLRHLRSWDFTSSGSCYMLVTKKTELGDGFMWFHVVSGSLWLSLLVLLYIIIVVAIGISSGVFWPLARDFLQRLLCTGVPRSLRKRWQASWNPICSSARWGHGHLGWPARIYSIYSTFQKRRA